MTPIEMDFFAFNPSKGSFRPYTYLSSNLRTKDDDMGAGGYGGYLEYFDDPALTERRAASGELPAGGEEHILHQDRPWSRRTANTSTASGGATTSGGCRCGAATSSYHGGEIPVTAVVGVQFTDNDIVAK